MQEEKAIELRKYIFFVEEMKKETKAVKIIYIKKQQDIVVNT